jgi:hypothetical protein
MARVVVLSITGDDSLWTVDLDALSVQPLAAPASGGLKAVADLRSTGTVVTKGVDIAVLVKSVASAASGQYDG